MCTVYIVHTWGRASLTAYLGGERHQSYTQLYLHLVWATWDRLPLIRPEFREAIYGCIQDQLRKHRCDVIAIGGIEDHVHVLTRFPTTAAVADIVKHAKGASSNLMTHTVAPREFFKGQGYYGAFTLAKRHAPHVRDYVLRQEEHHRTGRVSDVLERVYEERIVRTPAPSAA